MTVPLSTYGGILFSALLLWPAAAPAQSAQRPVTEAQSQAEPTGQTKSPDGEEGGNVTEFLSWSEQPHRTISDRLENLSQRLDSIFGEERIYHESTESYLQIRAGLLIERGEGLSIDQKLRLKIDLPRTEKRVKLVLESTDDDEDLLGNGAEDPSAIRNPGDSDDVSAALQFFIRESKRWNVSAGPGLRLRTPPDPFARLRVRRTQQLGPTWQTRLTERFTAYAQRGLESRTRIEFERRTGRDELFRLTSQVLWREEFANDNIQLSQGANFYKRLTRRDSIAYGAAVIWETRPNWHHEMYVADIRWRRRIHDKWLYLEIKPEARFERDEHFQFDPRLTLSLEVLFGRRYL